jgi:SAM-dependent methyltransferase
MGQKNSYFEKLSKKITHPSETTNNKSLNYLKKEISFIKRFITKDSEIIDIGSGTGLVVNRIHKDIKYLVAVEPFRGLSRFIVDDEKILLINAELTSFYIRKRFDFAICTGVSQFFNKKDITKIYNNIYEMLKKNGALILRVHCGLEKDVIINGYSKELDSEYYAEYRYLSNEVELLKQVGFNKIKVYDEVSDELNVWKDTKHFYLTCWK